MLVKNTPIEFAEQKGPKNIVHKIIVYKPKPIPFFNFSYIVRERGKVVIDAAKFAEALKAGISCAHLDIKVPELDRTEGIDFTDMADVKRFVYELLYAHVANNTNALHANDLTTCDEGPGPGSSSSPLTMKDDDVRELRNKLEKRVTEKFTALKTEGTSARASRDLTQPLMEVLDKLGLPEADENLLIYPSISQEEFQDLLNMAKAALGKQQLYRIDEFRYPFGEEKREMEVASLASTLFAEAMVAENSGGKIEKYTLEYALRQSGDGTSDNEKQTLKSSPLSVVDGLIPEHMWNGDGAELGEDISYYRYNIDLEYATRAHNARLAMEELEQEFILSVEVSVDKALTRGKSELWRALREELEDNEDKGGPTFYKINEASTDSIIKRILIGDISQDKFTVFCVNRKAWNKVWSKLSRAEKLNILARLEKAVILPITGIPLTPEAPTALALGTAMIKMRKELDGYGPIVKAAYRATTYTEFTGDLEDLASDDLEVQLKFLESWECIVPDIEDGRVDAIDQKVRDLIKFGTPEERA